MRESRQADVVGVQAMPLTLAEATWPWFHALCGAVLLVFYREILRLMVWARAMNW